MQQFIPYGRQCIDETDIATVVETLQSDWLTQGPRISEFEKKVAEYCAVPYAVAVSNGTAALHLACLALGVQPGDYVWTSPNTFVASANCARLCGAEVDFVDIDPHTYNMSLTALADKLKIAAQQNRLPKVVIPVHFAGQACALREIHQLAQQYKFAVIEDACHALGGQYYDEKIGNCKYSDAVVFSFHPVKLVTTGEGGMIVTAREDIQQKLRLLASHGITRNPELMHSATEGPWYYQQIGLGLNYRITDFQAALGASQLQRLDQFVARRHVLAQRYDQALKDLPVIVPQQEAHNYSAYHLYVIRLRLNKLTKTRQEIFVALRAANIGVNVHYIPVHTQPYYQQLGFAQGDFPAAEKYYAEALTLPLYPTLTEAEQDYVIRCLTQALQ